jgi:hypothetical protein
VRVRVSDYVAAGLSANAAITVTMYSDPAAIEVSVDANTDIAKEPGVLDTGVAVIKELRLEVLSIPKVSSILYENVREHADDGLEVRVFVQT